MKRVARYKHWTIYEAIREADREYLGGRYAAYKADESPAQYDVPEWVADDLRECIDFIDSYEEPETDGCTSCEMFRAMGEQILLEQARRHGKVAHTPALQDQR